jgi:threonylcarbamoyladenosine tRNA methylthiotransferase MtaB
MQKINMMFTIHFETLGCKLNQIETESIARFCADAGFLVTMEHSTASKTESSPILSIINTCTVTTKAEQKARRIIRMLLTKFPAAAILVTGCYAQVEKQQIESIDSRVFVVPGTAKDILADFPSFFMGILKKLEKIPQTKNDAKSLVEILKAWPPLKNNTTINNIAKDSKQNAITLAIGNDNKFRLATDSFMQHSRGSIKIQDGCSNKCAYCRICIARGQSVSIAPAEALKRIKNIEDSGHTEVVLTGVNLSLYKGTLSTENGEQEIDFAGLLKYLLENTNKISFRISSLYPERVDKTLCKIIAHKRIRAHFHLSVQSGSNKILKSMRRPYESEAIIQAVEQLRKAKDNPFIACDIIAGFPGETDDDFEQTKELCQKCNFTYIHAFPFSPRPDTEAYTMKNKVPERITKERIEWLSDFARKSKAKYAKSFVGKYLRAVVEKRESNIGKAVTENFLHIFIEENKQILKKYAGKEVIVLITKTSNIKGKEEETEAYAVLAKDKTFSNSINQHFNQTTAD